MADISIGVLRVPEILDCLVGRNQTLDEYGIYGDGYVARLNQVYPMAEIFGDRLEDIAKGKSPLYPFIMGTPLQDSDAESILRKVVYRSASAKLWQPEIVNESAFYGTISIKEGTRIAQESGFVKLTDLESGHKKIIIPSQKFVEYFLQMGREQKLFF